MKLFKNQECKSPERHPIKWWHIPLLILLIIGTIYVTNERKTGTTTLKWKTNEIQKCEGMTFGTYYHITYNYHTCLHDSIKAVLNNVDSNLSPFNSKSIITAINENTCYKTTPMFEDVFNLAEKITSETYGAFDITVADLVNAWGFGFKNMDKVTPETIDSLMPYVGMKNIHIENNKIVKKTPEIKLDCSAIAKGYGVDAVGLELEKFGIANYMVEIGGEIRIRGINPNGDKWRVGISKPNDDTLGINNDIMQIIEMSDASMATSGNYRNFYTKGNKKYAHTIDPRTGYPIQHNILSATVIADNCATADAYATAFMVLGKDSSIIVLQNHPELKAYFICSDNGDSISTWHSPNLVLE